MKPRLTNGMFNDIAEAESDKKEMSKTIRLFAYSIKPMIFLCYVTYLFCYQEILVKVY